jgi:hypothetical protein
MATALALAALVGLIAFAFFLMWGMPSIFRGHHNDGGDSGSGGSGNYASSDSFSDGGGHGAGGDGSGSH